MWYILCFFIDIIHIYVFSRCLRVDNVGHCGDYLQI